METPLTPLAFAARARRLYAQRDATVFEGERRSYEQFLDRIDRWSTRLQALGRKARRSGRLYRAERSLESGGLLRRAADRRDSGADQLPARGVRFRLHPQPFRREDRLRRQGLCRGDRGHPRRASAGRAFRRARKLARRLARLRGRACRELAGFRRGSDRRERPHHDQLHERHDGAAEGRDDHAPQRLSERARHARPFPDGPGGPLSLDAADVPRQRLDVHVAGDSARQRPRLPAQGRPVGDLQAGRRRGRHDAVRRADGADRHRECAGGGAGACEGPQSEAADGGRAARRGHHRPHRERSRLGGAARLRHDRDFAADPVLRAAARTRKALRPASAPSSRRGRASNSSAPAKSA